MEFYLLIFFRIIVVPIFLLSLIFLLYSFFSRLRFYYMFRVKGKDYKKKLRGKRIKLRWALITLLLTSISIVYYLLPVTYLESMSINSDHSLNRNITMNIWSQEGLIEIELEPEQFQEVMVIVSQFKYRRCIYYEQKSSIGPGVMISLTNATSGFMVVWVTEEGYVMKNNSTYEDKTGIAYKVINEPKELLESQLKKFIIENSHDEKSSARSPNKMLPQGLGMVKNPHGIAKRYS